MREEDIIGGLDAVAARDPVIAATLERMGYPGPRQRRGDRRILRCDRVQPFDEVFRAHAALLAKPGCYGTRPGA